MISRVKLNKSIRHELARFGNAIRAYHYALPGTVGILPRGGYLDGVYLDIDVNAGVCTYARLYYDGDPGRTRDDYYGLSLDVTDLVYDYLRHESTWSGMINEMCDLAETYIKDKTEDVK